MKNMKTQRQLRAVLVIHRTSDSMTAEGYLSIRDWAPAKYDEFGLNKIEPAKIVAEELKRISFVSWFQLLNWATAFDKVEVILPGQKVQRKSGKTARGKMWTLVPFNTGRKMSEQEQALLLELLGTEKPKSWAVKIQHEDPQGRMHSVELVHAELKTLKSMVRGYTKRLKDQGMKVSKLAKGAYIER